jgi:hypothetical protein
MTNPLDFTGKVALVTGAAALRVTIHRTEE